MKRPYLFYFPGYARSNGIRVMMLLAERLIAAGHTVFFDVKNPSGWEMSGHPRLTTIDENLRRTGIVVYPEIIAGNPLRFQNVVRFVLFYPGRNGGTRRYHKSEMVFAYLPEFLPGSNVLSVPWIDKTLFNDPGYPRTDTYCFVYKGGRWCDPPELRGIPTITMNWPATREELAERLKRTRVLYSFDAESALLEEACACGAQAKIVTRDGFRNYTPIHARMEREFESQFRRFVEITQASDYRGPLQSRFLWLYWAYAVWRYWVKPMLIAPKLALRAQHRLAFRGRGGRAFRARG